MFGISCIPVLVVILMTSRPMVDAQGDEHTVPDSPAQPEPAGFDIRPRLPGISCGDVRCLGSGQARCESPRNNLCECRRNKRGDGELSCHERRAQHEQVCSITLAGSVSNFKEQESTRVSNPCMYLGAYIETVSQGRSSLRCKIWVNVLGERSIGHFFPRGFTVRIREEFRRSTREHQYRAWGLYKLIDYEYTLQEFDTDSRSWKSATSMANNPDVTFEVDDDKRVVLRVIPCGLKVYFRGENPIEGEQQTAKSGLVISVDREAVRVNPSTQDGVCLDTERGHGDLMDDSGFSSPDLALRFLAFSTAAATGLPGESSNKCFLVRNVLTENCGGNPTVREEGMRQCDFMLSMASFVQCVEGRSGASSERVLEMYGNCVAAVCRGSRTDCVQVKRDVNRSGCTQVAQFYMDRLDCDMLN